MSEAVLGINQVLLFRLLEEQATGNGAKLAFQTEHEVSESVDSDSVVTKDGNIIIPQSLETEISVTSVLAKDDELVTKLRTAMRKRKKVEVWEVDISQPHETEENKYKAMYFQGFITEFTKTPAAEDALEVEMTLNIEGEGQEGYATLSAAQAEVVQYVFEDTTPKVSP